MVVAIHSNLQIRFKANSWQLGAGPPTRYNAGRKISPLWPGLRPGKLRGYLHGWILICAAVTVTFDKSQQLTSLTDDSIAKLWRIAYGNSDSDSIQVKTSVLLSI